MSATIFSEAFGTYTTDPICGFDLDGTLVASIRETVTLCPMIIDKLRECVNIVIFSNQLRMPQTTPEMLRQFGKLLLQYGINSRIYVACADNEFRKPNVGMYGQFCTDVGRTMAYFVGDMDTDKKFAANCNVPYFHPLEYFKYRIPVIKTRMIMLIGYPASGKSTLARQIANCVKDAHIVNHDTENSKAAVKRADFYAQNSTSNILIIDNLNHTEKARKPYLDIARAHKLGVTLIYTNISVLESITRNEARDNKVPPVAIYSCRKYLTLCSLEELVGLNAESIVLPPFYRAV